MIASSEERVSLAWISKVSGSTFSLTVKRDAGGLGVIFFKMKLLHC